MLIFSKPHKIKKPLRFLKGASLQLVRLKTKQSNPLRNFRAYWDSCVELINSPLKCTIKLYECKWARDSKINVLDQFNNFYHWHLIIVFVNLLFLLLSQILAILFYLPYENQTSIAIAFCRLRGKSERSN